MTLRTILLAAAAAIVALTPTAGQAGAPPVIVAPGLAVTPGACSGALASPVCLDVPGASTVYLTCSAVKGRDGMIVKASQVSAFRFAVTGGTLAASEVAVAPADASTATVAWNTPPEGGASASCWAVAGVDVSTPSNAAVALVAPPPRPDVTALVPPPGKVLSGKVLGFSVTATDPAGGALTYLWQATGGLFDGQGTPAITWVAPDASGPVTIKLTVSNEAGGSAVQLLTFDVAAALPQGSLPAEVRQPRRIAASPSGRLGVVDASGKFLLLTRLGGALAAPVMDAGAVSVAGAPGAFFVGTDAGEVLKIDERSGRTVARYALGAPKGPTGLAYDAATGLLWMTHREAGMVQAVRADGSSAFATELAGAAKLDQVSDVAVDASSGLVWVTQDANVYGPLLHAFQGDGTFVKSVAASADFLTAGGVAAANGKIYVSDGFAGHVQVVGADGASLGKLGTYGAGPGELRMPAGMTVLANGDLVVANKDVGRLDRFGNGAALVACAGDTDCDGLSDEAELAAGLNPNDPGDALADADADGLSNQDELLAGTNPFKVDTDGDGFSDAAELLAGFNPLDPGDHKATLVATAAAESAPGLIRVTGVAGGPGACAVAWKQVGGPTVALAGAASASPAFIARAVGAYVLEGVATCGDGVKSDPARVTVNVTNVAPVADAGRATVVERGEEAELFAGWSSDANGGRLTFTWEQVAGPAARTEGKGARLAVRPLRAGYHAFKLTARDAGGATGSTEVPVILVERASKVPTAMAISKVVTGQAGAPVALEVVVPEGGAVSWEQVSGPLAGSYDNRSAATAFTPSMAGRYVFRATAWRGEVRSAPEVVEAYVAPAGAALPVARAAAPATAAVNAAVTLDGSASAAAAGGALTYRWRQVTGPAAGLTAADADRASVVAFAPGFYEFELAVAEGDAAAVPVRVAFEARLGGRPIPVAAASTAGTATAGDLVLLDGRASTAARHFTWTQVSGPWVALKSSEAVATFVPPAAGQYVFELVVDDGSVRSRPQQVSVLVMGEEN